MAVRYLTTGRNLILGNDTKNGHHHHHHHQQSSNSSTGSNNHNQTEVFFNFSLKVAYDVILKSRQSEVLLPEIEILLIAIYVLLMTSGVVSNVLVCFVVRRQCARKKMDVQKSRNLYVVNLAVADLALCCICTPFTLISLIKGEWVFGSLLCKLVPVVQGTNITVSAGTITAIALDRYNIIVKSTSSNNVQTRNRSRVVITIILIWISSLVLSSPLFFYTVTESVTFEDVFLYEKCIERWPSRDLRSAFAVTLALIQFAIPVFVLSAIHLKISSYLRFHIRPLRKSGPEIQIHSPIDPIEGENNSGGTESNTGRKKSKDDSSSSSKMILLYIKRRESMGSENSNRSCESSQKLSDFSRKNSDSSKNSCDLSPRKRSDLFLSFRENSDFYGFSFSRFSSKSKSGKSQRGRDIRRNRRTTFILSCIALVYAVSWLPMTVFQVASALVPQVGPGPSPKSVQVIFSFCHLLAMSSAVTNPLLYGWLNTNFRREFSTVFSCASNFCNKILTSEFFNSLRRKKAAKGGSGKTKNHEIFA